MAIPTISLKQTQFNPIEFKPLGYEPKVADVSILANSLANIENRMNKATETQSAIDAALGKIETQLHQDEETALWFQDKKNKIKETIQDQINIGNYGAAIRVGTKLAGEIASDTELAARIKSNEQYKKIVDDVEKRVEEGQVTRQDADWFLANNKYKHENITDGQGNVIGGKEIKLKPLYNSLNVAELFLLADKFTVPFKTSTGSTTINSDGTYSGTGYSRERKTKEQLAKAVLQELTNTTDGINRLRQTFESFKYKLKQLEERKQTANNEEKANIDKEISYIKPLITRNDSEDPDLEHFVEQMLVNNGYMDTLSYDYIQTDSKTSNYNKIDNSDTSSNDGSLSFISEGNVSNSTSSPNVEVVVDSSNILGRYNDNSGNTEFNSYSGIRSIK